MIFFQLRRKIWKGYGRKIGKKPSILLNKNKSIFLLLTVFIASWCPKKALLRKFQIWVQCTFLNLSFLITAIKNENHYLGGLVVYPCRENGQVEHQRRARYVGFNWKSRIFFFNSIVILCLIQHRLIIIYLVCIWEFPVVSDGRHNKTNAMLRYSYKGSCKLTAWAAPDHIFSKNGPNVY